MTLTSARLLYEPYSETHFQDIFKQNADPELMRYIRPPAQAESEVRERLNKWIGYLAENPGFNLWVVKTLDNQQFVGNVLLRHADFNPSREVEVGYVFNKDCWGKGFATEAVERLKLYAKEAMAVDFIVAFTDPQNLASGRVLEKSGFVDVGREVIYGSECVRWEWGRC